VHRGARARGGAPGCASRAIASPGLGSMCGTFFSRARSSSKTREKPRPHLASRGVEAKASRWAVDSSVGIRRPPACGVPSLTSGALAYLLVAYAISAHRREHVACSCSRVVKGGSHMTRLHRLLGLMCLMPVVGCSSSGRRPAGRWTPIFRRRGSLEHPDQSFESHL